MGLIEEKLNVCQDWSFIILEYACNSIFSEVLQGHCTGDKRLWCWVLSMVPDTRWGLRVPLVITGGLRSCHSWSPLCYNPGPSSSPLRTRDSPPPEQGGPCRGRVVLPPLSFYAPNRVAFYAFHLRLNCKLSLKRKDSPWTTVGTALEEFCLSVWGRSRFSSLGWRQAAAGAWHPALQTYSLQEIDRRCQPTVELRWCSGSTRGCSYPSEYFQCQPGWSKRLQDTSVHRSTLSCLGHIKHVRAKTWNWLAPSSYQLC